MNDTIRLLYLEPHRHYHTMQHIAECLAWYERVKGMESHPLDLHDAIWLHDAVYRPTRGDNEKQSALLSDNENVRRLLMWTDHRRRDRGEYPSDIDAQLIHDIDLSILGSHPKRFNEYCQQIRWEYDHVPEPEYRAARATVLRGFLRRKPLFYTDYFHYRLDTLARENLVVAIAEMEEGP